MSETNDSFLTNMTSCTAFKYSYSTALLLFCIVIVMTLIFEDQTEVADSLHSSVAFVLVWLALVWLSMVEGGQGALVGLAPVSKDLYKTSHPITHLCCELGHRGDNLDRYLIGRQFLVFLLVFVVNLCGAPLADASIFGWSDVVQEALVRSGLAIILLTAMVGQLHCQVNASHCMLDYIDTYFMYFTLRVSLALEASGAMHAVYLLQMLFAKLSGKPIESKAPRTTTRQSIWFWLRVVFSVGLLGVSFAVTLTALFNNQTNMWSGIPASVSVVLFFAFIVVLGILEGTQIAVFAMSRMPLEELEHHPTAMRSMELLFKGGGANIPKFLIGRQIIVTLLAFILARVTSIDVDVDNNESTIWGVPKGLQEFFNTGLLGAVIVTIVGSITWKLVGSAFPIFFLQNPFVYLLLRLCLLLEASGICSGAWVLAFLHRKIAGFKQDETYVGTPEDRAAREKPDSFVEGSRGDCLSLQEAAPMCGSSRYLQVDDLVSRASNMSLSRHDNSSHNKPSSTREYSSDDDDNDAEVAAAQAAANAALNSSFLSRGSGHEGRSVEFLEMGDDDEPSELDIDEEQAAIASSSVNNGGSALNLPFRGSPVSGISAGSSSRRQNNLSVSFHGLQDDDNEQQRQEETKSNASSSKPAERIKDEGSDSHNTSNDDKP